MKKTTYFIGIWGFEGSQKYFWFWVKFYGVHMAVKNLTDIFLAQLGDLVIESVIKFVSWLLISASFSVDNDYFDCIDYNDWNDYRDYIDYNDYSDYNDYNNYNDYRDSDLDLDWERFCELVT